MSSKSVSAGSRLGVRPEVIAIAIVVLITLVGWFYYQNLTPHEYFPPARPGTQEKIAWINQKAKETGGDYNKLSPGDRTLLEQKTENHGAMALSMAAKALNN